MVADLIVGVKVYPVMLGVIVYPPLANPVNRYLPRESVVVVADAVPLNVIVTPAIGLPLAVFTAPDMEYAPPEVVPVKFCFVIFAPLMVTDLLVGVNVYPALFGVTV